MNNFFENNWPLLLLLLTAWITAEYLKQPRTSKRLWKVKPPTTSPIPYTPPQPARQPYKAKPLMTRTEQVLFQRLKEALPPECHVHAQVALSQLLDIDKNEDIAAFNAVNQKSVDFVVTFAPPNKPMVIAAAIELDDRSHLKRSRQAADEVKNQALLEAGIPLIRWKVEAMPTVEEIRKRFIG